MKKSVLFWSPVVLFVLIMFFVWELRGVARTSEEIELLKASLVQDKCTKTEAVDRLLLQQTWYHDQQFKKLAGAFGQHGFSLYEIDGPNREAREGAFCINDTDLMIRYYDRSYVPISVDFSPFKLTFGIKLKPLADDIYTVRELTKYRMVLVSAVEQREHVYFRKN